MRIFHKALVAACITLIPWLLVYLCVFHLHRNQIDSDINDAIVKAKTSNTLPIEKYVDMEFDLATGQVTRSVGVRKYGNVYSTLILRDNQIPTRDFTDIYINDERFRGLCDVYPPTQGRCTFVKIDAVAAHTSNSLRWTVIFIIIGAALSLVVVVFGTQKLVRPIELLTRAVTRVGRNSEGFELGTIPNDEVGYLATAIENMLTRLQATKTLSETLAIKSTKVDIAQQVTHDIDSPWTSIVMGIETIRNEISPEQYVLFKNQIKRINGMLEDLERVKQENFMPNSSNKKFDLGNTIREIISEKEFEFRGKAIQIFLEVNSDRAILLNSIKELDLKRIISNIVNNSVEAAPKDGTIRIQVNHSNTTAMILIHDSGTPLPDHLLPKIFEQGFTYGKEEGTGIGLFTSRKLIEAAAGHITFDSLSNGTRVTLTLPLAIPLRVKKKTSRQSKAMTLSPGNSKS